MKRRKLSNPLALAILVTLVERPMHPYEIARLLKTRGKDHSIKINFGSLYTVVQNLERHGFVEAAGTEQEGNRPERTLYALTPAGRAEMHDWLSHLVAVPAREYPLFETALALILALPFDEARRLLDERLALREAQAAGIGEDLAKWKEILPGVLLIEAEYQLHMVQAEVAWLRGFCKELDEGGISGVDGWREMSETGKVPQEMEILTKLTNQT